MNIFDWIALALIALLAVSGYHRGLLRAAFGLVSLVVAYLLARAFYPYLSGFLRDTGLYGSLQNSVSGFMRLDALASVPANAQADALSKLHLPGFLINSITASNNPEAYKTLGVDTFGGFVGGYVANAILSLIAMVVVFIVVIILMRVVSRLLKSVNKIPIIGFLNKLGGLAFGCAEGAALVLAAVTVITLVVLKPGYSGVFEQVKSGPVAGFFYAHNIIMQAVAQIH